MGIKFRWLFVVAFVVFAGSLPARAQRVGDGLIALYEFNEGAGTVVGDSSGFGNPLDLLIGDDDMASGLIEWGNGFISINRGTSVAKEDGTFAPIPQSLASNSSSDRSSSFSF